MNIELEKYRADIFKIAGFAVMTPLGKLFIDPVNAFKDFGFIGLLVYAFVCLLFFFFGLLLFAKGYEALDFSINKDYK